MAIRTKIDQMSTSDEKKEYFASKYSIGKVCDLDVGKEVYCIPLNLEEGVYQIMRHRVKAKKKDIEGFKGKYDTWIRCKGYDDFGNKVDGALCCQLAQEEFEKHKEDYQARMIAKSSVAVYIPVLVLGASGVDKGAKKYPPTKLSIKSYAFSYLEMSLSTYNKTFITPFITKLKDDGIIPYELEGEDLQVEVAKHLKKTLIKVAAQQGKPGFSYEKSYSFIPFSNKNIGAETEQYKYIVNYDKVTKVKNDIVDFITLFDTEVDNLCVNWTDAELQKYLVDDVVRSEKLDRAIASAEASKATSIPKSEQVVTVKEEAPVMVGEEEIEFEASTENSALEEDFDDGLEMEDLDEGAEEQTTDLDDDLLSLEMYESFIDA